MIEQSPHVPVASQVWIAPALHVVVLPHGCVVFGMHDPAHWPWLQRKGQVTPFCH
jgi:hypothetical protein